MKMLPTLDFGRRFFDDWLQLRLYLLSLRSARERRLSQLRSTQPVQRAGVWYSAGASTGLVLLLQTSRRKLTRLSNTKFASHQKIGFGCIIAGKLPSRIFFSPNTNAASTCRREFHVATSSHFEFSSVQATGWATL